MNRGKAKAQILGLRPRGSNPILLLEHGVISGRRFRVAGLFAGVGGLELGLGRAGHETMMLCEIDPPARAVLETRFPSLPLEDDVRKVETSTSWSVAFPARISAKRVRRPESRGRTRDWSAKCVACSKRGRSLGSSWRTCHSCCGSRREEPWT